MSFDPNQHKIFLYTNECTTCGRVTLDTENRLREKIKDAGYQLYVKEVPLYQGWRIEAQTLGGTIPFFYNYDTNVMCDYGQLIVSSQSSDDTTEKGETIRRLNEELLETFLKKEESQ